MPVRVLPPQSGPLVTLTIQIGDREPIKVTLDGPADSDVAAAASYSDAEAVVYSLARARRIRQGRRA